MTPDELDTIEAAHDRTCLYCSLAVAKAEPCSLALAAAALREAWAHEETMRETWRGAVEVTLERDALRAAIARVRALRPVAHVCSPSDVWLPYQAVRAALDGEA